MLILERFLFLCLTWSHQMKKDVILFLLIENIKIFTPPPNGSYYLNEVKSLRVSRKGFTKDNQAKTYENFIYWTRLKQPYISLSIRLKENVSVSLLCLTLLHEFTCYNRDEVSTVLTLSFRFTVQVTVSSQWPFCPNLEWQVLKVLTYNRLDKGINWFLKKSKRLRFCL